MPSKIIPNPGQRGRCEDRCKRDKKGCDQGHCSETYVRPSTTGWGSDTYGSHQPLGPEAADLSALVLLVVAHAAVCGCIDFGEFCPEQRLRQALEPPERGRGSCRDPSTLTVLNVLVSLLLISCLFAAIYKVLPDRDLQWSDVVVGAMATAILFTIGEVANQLVHREQCVARTTNAIERLHEEFKRRIKTQTVLPSAETAADPRSGVRERNGESGGFLSYVRRTL